MTTNEQASHDSAPAVSPAIPAATVIVGRDGSRGLEVLLLRRSDIGAFAGMWVFPGGRVDADDAGHDGLTRAASAAVREAREEVALELDVSTLVPVSHWEPPMTAPKRFATWFFVAPWQRDDVRVDGHEIVEHRWITPTDALSAGVSMAPPTWVTLHHLGTHRDLSSLIAPSHRAVEHYATRPAVTGGGAPVLLWHGDAGYDTFDAEAIGERHRMWMDVPWRYERTGAPAAGG